MVRSRVGKEQNETSCVDQLMKSDGFMTIARSRYAELVEKARKGECGMEK